MINYMTWTQEIHLRPRLARSKQGVFVILKDYDVTLHPWSGPEEFEAKWMAQHLQTVDSNLRHRHTRFAYADYDPPHVLSL